jgi:hypothetical protein
MSQLVDVTLDGFGQPFCMFANWFLSRGDARSPIDWKSLSSGIRSSSGIIAKRYDDPGDLVDLIRWVVAAIVNGELPRRPICPRAELGATDLRGWWKRRFE